jgi:hypothetical protein
VTKLALFASLLFSQACTLHGPVVADVRCPKGAKEVATETSGRCVLPDGKRHGPSWSVSEHGVDVEGYDHDVPAGPFEHYDHHGRLVACGYRSGVTDSTDQPTDVSEAEWDSPATSGKLVSPARVRIFPVQADVAFAASTLVSAEGKAMSSFVGGALDIATTPKAMLRWRGDAYRAFFVAYGAQGLAGAIARADCDDPTIAGSGGFCGSRWMAGPFVRIGYVRSEDAHPSGALASLLFYGKAAFLIGRDQWSGAYGSGEALVWRFRAGAGYTALGSLAALARQASASASDAWKWILVPIALVLEHAEGYVEIGNDGATALGVGGGVEVGFGL